MSHHRHHYHHHHLLVRYFCSVLCNCISLSLSRPQAAARLPPLPFLNKQIHQNQRRYATSFRRLILLPILLLLLLLIRLLRERERGWKTLSHLLSLCFRSFDLRTSPKRSTLDGGHHRQRHIRAPLIHKVTCKHVRLMIKLAKSELHLSQSYTTIGKTFATRTS